jgi:deoxyribodipyrimidine photolyase
MNRRVESIKEEIEELKKKLTLLEGDKKACLENTQWDMEKNRILIQQLRKENKDLRNRLAKKMAADDDVIYQVFKENNSKPPPELRGLPAQDARARFDQIICELIKQRNALQHEARNRQRQLESLQKQLAYMKFETDLITSTPAGESAAAKQFRHLESQLDNAVIRCNEAAQINKIYEGILEKLQKERLNYDNEITDLKKAISVRKKNLKDLENMYKDAENARSMAKVSI